MNRREPGSILLSIETSGDQCGVAVLRDGVTAVEQTFRHRMHLSEGLLDSVRTLLNLADFALPDVTAIAVGIGPGSFTGTRIGVMTAKTLAAVQGIPLYGIVGLEAIARAYRGLQGVAVVPMLPCRTDLVFTACYDVSGAALKPAIEPDALALDALVDRLLATSSSHILLCGAAAARYGDIVRDGLRAHGMHVSLGDERYPRPEHVGAIAFERIAAGLPSDAPFDLVPLYISPPPITMPRIPIPE
jgi:tRNA threonylcarbamoyladenosine biosynthesis protein TsaB